MPKRRLLPRFEVVRIGSRFVAYDFLTHTGHFATDSHNFDATQGLVERLAVGAGKRGEDLAVLRDETLPVTKPRSRTAKPQAH